MEDFIDAIAVGPAVMVTLLLSAVILSVFSLFNSGLFTLVVLIPATLYLIYDWQHYLAGHHGHELKAGYTVAYLALAGLGGLAVYGGHYASLFFAFCAAVTLTVVTLFIKLVTQKP